MGRFGYFGVREGIVPPCVARVSDEDKWRYFAPLVNLYKDHDVISTPKLVINLRAIGFPQTLGECSDEDLAILASLPEKPLTLDELRKLRTFEVELNLAYGASYRDPCDEVWLE